MVDKKRIKPLNNILYSKGAVAYWMSRDQRVHDNWALLYAQELAHTSEVPLIVIFCVVPSFLQASLRQYDFMLKGLQEVEKELHKYHIPFFLLCGDPTQQISHFINKQKIGILVTDFSPLRIFTTWHTAIVKKIDIPFHQVDTHNIVPAWVASPKQEFAARTFRPKIHRQLPTFLTPFPRLKKQNLTLSHHAPKHVWKSVYATLRVDVSVKPVAWIKPGEKAARRMLTHFLNKKLTGYATSRNDPTVDGQSNLSPYLHFGQICSQTIARAVRDTHAPKSDKDAFLEELIVRKELSDNYCFYNKTYDSIKSIALWAHKTLMQHARDKREKIYTVKEFEYAQTGDPLWNAAQIEMVNTGKMHGFMRMYWAKKILEWTKSPATAFKVAIYLNDKYELDGRDPNGYVGIAWSIGGVHDRAWGERSIFGKIRFMSYNGCASKFDVDAYIQQHKTIKQ